MVVGFGIRMFVSNSGRTKHRNQLRALCKGITQGCHTVLIYDIYLYVIKVYFLINDIYLIFNLCPCFAIASSHHRSL